MNTPWKVSETSHERVCILAADNRVVTEIIPGQVGGTVVSQHLRLSVARFIVHCVNTSAQLFDEVEMPSG